MKQVIKNNLLGFLLGAIIFGVVGVYAGNTINGDDILYDNSESGLTSDTMQGAINELYDKANYGDAEATQILSGITALVGGKKVTGTMSTKAAETYYATTSDQTISADQYLSGAQTIKGLSSTNYSAGNIKAGTTISVSNGNANVYSVAGTFTSDGTATAAQILKDKIAYVNGSKITGTMANNGATGGTINPGGSYTIPAGYTSGGTVTANANQNSGTYTPTSRSASLDMGVNNTYRYVNTNSVPNTNSATYTFASGSTGAKVDLGATNTYRYVDASNVYSAGGSTYKSYWSAFVSNGSTITQTTGSKQPKYVCIIYAASTTHVYYVMYDAVQYPGKWIIRDNTTTANNATANLGATSGSWTFNVTSTGFTFKDTISSRALFWFAVA